MFLDRSCDGSHTDLPQSDYHLWACDVAQAHGIVETTQQERLVGCELEAIRPWCCPSSDAWMSSSASRAFPARMARGGGPGRGETSAERGESPMRILEVAISVVPSIAVLTLAWFVVRAISVRVVWREPGQPARER